MRSFVAQTGVGGPGWRHLQPDAHAGNNAIGKGLLQAFLGCIAVYAALMATGSLLYGHGIRAAVLFVVAGLAAGAVLYLHRRS